MFLALQDPDPLVRGRVLDPDSIRSVDPDPYSRRAKMTHFFCNLNVLYGGLGIGKL
jgi:hypothetical protein